MSSYSMKPKDQTPQGIGSVITYMRRYALSAVLGVAADEDDDGNAASEPEKKPAAKKAKTREEIESEPPFTNTIID